VTLGASAPYNRWDEARNRVRDPRRGRRSLLRRGGEHASHRHESRGGLAAGTAAGSEAAAGLACLDRFGTRSVALEWRAYAPDARIRVEGGPGGVQVALTGAGPKRGCPKQRTFALVGASHDNGAVVERGGCYRVERPDRLAGTANPAVVRAILGAR
jgi:hypothetical protein